MPTHFRGLDARTSKLLDLELLARFQAKATAAPRLLVGATLHCVVWAHIGQVFPEQLSWSACLHDAHRYPLCT